MNETSFILIILAVAAVVGITVFSVCLYWFRREQQLMQKKILQAIAETGRESNDLFLTGRNATEYGELVAQFKVNHGKRVVSVLESDGKRYLHVDGEFSPIEREKMVRYLRSEGFMS